MKRPWLAAFFLLAFTAACAVQAPAGISTQGPTGAGKGRCGDGVCDGPESASGCPADCTDEGAATPPLQVLPPTRQATAAEVVPTGAPSSQIPPLYFFYVIHTHVSDDHLPYLSPAHDRVSSSSADNMLAAIRGIAAVLDAHDLPGTWEVTGPVASGLCSYQGQDHVFAQLKEGGHEVAAHGHSLQGLLESQLALQAECGITASTASGFMTEIGRADPADAQSAMASEIEAALNLGMHVGTENLSPADQRNPFGTLCSSAIGPGNDMWPETGNLMFPWRPDYGGGDICADNPRGEMVFVDHVSITWTIPAEGDPPADILGDEDFRRLEAYLQAALDYAASHRPDRPVVWGFVTHIIEYSPGGLSESPPNPESLSALDRFLTRVDLQRSAGRVVYVTASEAAALAFP